MEFKESPKYSPEIARIVRLEFERIAKRVEKEAGNSAYRCAFAKAARIIRANKPD
jgi:hypothetical protein